ncbi:hypothetical protein ASAP_1648 [Asaia bogorensis]|uniref:Uncharacterized protein n=3 Tax=Acetobacteraceae TaxID=433 RepID=A0A060QGB8_9PROT|nr:hypothetical protein ASAP_1648 [Asaia bogorensis]
MAIRFEKAFGVRAETLMRMQSTFDLAQARAHTSELCIQHFGIPNRANTVERRV